MVTQLRRMPAEKPIKWTSVDVQEVINSDHRLTASMYSNDGRQARKDLIEKCKWDTVYLCGENGLATAYYGTRFRRIYVDKQAFPIYQPAQINELYPKPSAYISHATQTDIDALRVKRGQILLTCSGTIGNCTYVRNTLHNLIFSHDVIRIEPKAYNGFIYAFLKSKTGFSIVNTNNYGAVIEHIEPENLNHIPIPNPPPALKQEIHDLIEDSFRLRDESNELMDEAQLLLKTALQLPSIEAFHERSDQFDKMASVLNYSVSSSEVVDRLDGSYYVPIVKAIEQHIVRTAREVAKVGDGQISQSITLPGRFKRIYVEEGSGVVFLGGKQIHELDPSNKKYISISRHTKKIKNELTIKEGMILITRAGTPGTTAFVPQHWDGWAITDNIISLVPISNGIAGYLYTWLSSDYGQELLHRFVCGSVVSYLEKEHILQLSVPLLRNESTQGKINDTVLEANRKRTEAYNLEQKALKVLDEKVIYARGNG